MSDLKMHPVTGDLLIQGGDLLLTHNADAVAQHIKQRLRTFLGEWFLDIRSGVPYFEQVNVKNPSPMVLDSIFKSVICNTPGVEELLDFDIVLDDATRVLTLTFSVRTLDQEIDFTEQLGVAG